MNDAAKRRRGAARQLSHVRPPERRVADCAIFRPSISLCRRSSAIPCAEHAHWLDSRAWCTGRGLDANAHHRMVSTHRMLLHQVPRSLHGRDTRLLQRPSPRQAALKPRSVQADSSHGRRHCSSSRPTRHLPLLDRPTGRWRVPAASPQANTSNPRFPSRAQP
eukprot:COSAG06_NODE_6805_length_2769_cov_10.317978_3_plen_163_part_00